MEGGCWGERPVSSDSSVPQLKNCKILNCWCQITSYQLPTTYCLFYCSVQIQNRTNNQWHNKWSNNILIITQAWHQRSPLLYNTVNMLSLLWNDVHFKRALKLQFYSEVNKINLQTSCLLYIKDCTIYQNSLNHIWNKHSPFAADQEASVHLKYHHHGLRRG